MSTVVADGQVGVQPVEHRVGADPAVAADLDVVQDEALVVHRRALAEAEVAGQVPAILQEAAGGHVPVELRLEPLPQPGQVPAQVADQGRVEQAVPVGVGVEGLAAEEAQRPGARRPVAGLSRLLGTGRRSSGGCSAGRSG